MFKNCFPIIKDLIHSNNKLKRLQKHFHIFDQKFCHEMSALQNYQPLMENEWDFFKSLEVLMNEKDGHCEKFGFNASNILLVDSDSEKV